MERPAWRSRVVLRRRVLHRTVKSPRPSARILRAARAQPESPASSAFKNILGEGDAAVTSCDIAMGHRMVVRHGRSPRRCGGTPVMGSAQAVGSPEAVTSVQTVAPPGVAVVRSRQVATGHNGHRP